MSKRQHDGEFIIKQEVERFVDQTKHQQCRIHHPVEPQDQLPGKDPAAGSSTRTGW